MMSGGKWDGSLRRHEGCVDSINMSLLIRSWNYGVKGGIIWGWERKVGKKLRNPVHSMILKIKKWKYLQTEKIKSQRFALRSQPAFLFVFLRDARVLRGHPFPLRLLSGGLQDPLKSPWLCRQGRSVWPLGASLLSSVLLCVLFSLLSPTEAPCFTSQSQGPGASATVVIYPRSWEQRRVQKSAFWEARGETGLLPIDMFFIIVGTSWLIYWAPKLLQMVTAAMNLKDTCSLEENLWPT